MNGNQTYDPLIHHRKSIRLNGYDYSLAGAYFITICVQHRDCLFGTVKEHEMMLNPAGLMIDKWWQKIPEKFPDIDLGEYQIMPNHFHAIVVNNGSFDRTPLENTAAVKDKVLGLHTSSPLYQLVQWFKTMTTNEYIRNVKTDNWTPFKGKLWQRNYYEHIIRNAESGVNINNYIKNNPANWEEDIFFHSINIFFHF